MSRPLPPYLSAVLQLYVRGYSSKAIAGELKYKPSAVRTYIKRIKEYFKDEPEMQNDSLSSSLALMLIGQKYLSKNGEETCILLNCPYYISHKNPEA